MNASLCVVKPMYLGGSVFCFLRRHSEGSSFIGVSPSVVAGSDALTSYNVKSFTDTMFDDIIGFFFASGEEVITLAGVIKAEELRTRF